MTKDLVTTYHLTQSTVAELSRAILLSTPAAIKWRDQGLFWLWYELKLCFFGVIIYKYMFCLCFVMVHCFRSKGTKYIIPLYIGTIAEGR